MTGAEKFKSIKDFSLHANRHTSLPGGRRARLTVSPERRAQPGYLGTRLAAPASGSELDYTRRFPARPSTSNTAGSLP